MTTKDCLICGVDELTHRRLEADGTFNHQFSSDGELKMIERGPTRPKQPPVIVANGVDLVLRQALIRKGIITDEDLAVVLDPGIRPSRDRDYRAEPPPE